MKRTKIACQNIFWLVQCVTGYHPGLLAPHTADGASLMTSLTLIASTRGELYSSVFCDAVTSNIVLNPEPVRSMEWEFKSFPYGPELPELHIERILCF